MTGEPMGNTGRMRQLTMMGLAFYSAIGVMLIVLVVLSSGWEETDEELVRIGTWVAGIAGILGVGLAVWWRNRAVSQPVQLPRLFNTFLVTVAIAEIGMLLGLVFSISGQSFIPFAAGAVPFAIALTVMITSLNQVEIAEPL